MSNNYKQRYAIQKKNEERVLALKPNIDNESGIYFFLRLDENNIKYAYVGQAKHLLKRVAEHLSGYQHIDLSLKKHGFYPKNPYGWRISFLHYPESELDEWEKHWIKVHADSGFQLRNKTAGGQGSGKIQIDEYRPVKGYHDGIKQGRKTMARDLKHIIDTHLVVNLRLEKVNNEISKKALEKFYDLLNEGNNEE